MPTVTERFQAFHRRNPHVYDLFRRFAVEALESGRPRFSADCVLHRIRWFEAVETRGGAFKVNDAAGAFYARMLAAEDPRFARFFRFRASAADGRGRAVAGAA